MTSRTARNASIAVAGVAVLAGAGLAALRLADARADAALGDALMDAARAGTERRFDPVMVADLPEAARRYFMFAIAPGTPLSTVARIEMGGTLDLGSRDAPSARPMRARQVLAPPHGLVWSVRTGGAMAVTGSDALGPNGSWSRFRILGGIPVGRVSGEDHRRSSFGRMVWEGLFWTPAAFLPDAEAGWDALEWESVDAATARVTVRHGGLEQSADVTVDGDGRPLRIVFPRWSDENPERAYRLQPFGGDLSGFETIAGFQLPTRVVGGNHYGTVLYRPFFRAEVTEVTFP
jgi:hypothetical protein